MTHQQKGETQHMTSPHTLRNGGGKEEEERKDDITSKQNRFVSLVDDFV